MVAKVATFIMSGSKRKAPEIERNPKKVKRGNVKSKPSRKKKKSSSWEDLLMMK